MGTLHLVSSSIVVERELTSYGDSQLSKDMSESLPNESKTDLDVPFRMVCGV